MTPFALLGEVFFKKLVNRARRLPRYSRLCWGVQKLAIHFLSNGIAPLKLDAANQAKVVKFSESMWKLTYYATVEICILSMIYQEPWFTDRKQFFEGWPNQELKFTLILYYMCQCGFYAYSIAAILKWETRRKDFHIMMSHHVITVVLIWMSFISRFFRIGSIILALHDVNDVFMETAKLSKYTGNEHAASTCFGFFAISWFLLRLIYFPFWVIRSSSHDAVDVFVLSKGYHSFLYYLLNTMLITLLIFHIYWGILIFFMVSRQLKNRGQVGEDIRSDSDNED
ncbi:hypothetical protein AMTR_s00091p00092100 [Amborella trichopoda]|uniref:TLC domain-containing protein n=1 Tax=Amborella trichopoda TaxID=13333 RepID=W1P0X7_AMBTC|nr:hypothetical protein AMTR_s00091p00092100 [Amborella trichopoda]